MLYDLSMSAVSNGDTTPFKNTDANIFQPINQNVMLEQPMKSN